MEYGGFIHLREIVSLQRPVILNRFIQKLMDKPVFLFTVCHLNLP
ncbi:hypothetical protein PAERUG_E6_London_17_VIM_2_12_12_03312 [Pseudomonas aeruginosa]|nr:hypothetical protein PAERUG_E6_London_17_VIM_2_12_12_03312 [Pseudomonas aeruginosa]